MAVVTTDLPAVENRQLREIMEICALTQAQVVEITGYSDTQVYSWLRPRTSSNYRDMKPRALQTLKVQLGLEPPAFVALIAGRKGKLLRALRAFS